MALLFCDLDTSSAAVLRGRISIACVVSGSACETFTSSGTARLFHSGTSEPGVSNRCEGGILLPSLLAVLMGLELLGEWLCESANRSDTKQQTVTARGEGRRGMRQYDAVLKGQPCCTHSKHTQRRAGSRASTPQIRRRLPPLDTQHLAIRERKPRPVPSRHTPTPPWPACRCPNEGNRTAVGGCCWAKAGRGWTPISKSCAEVGTACFTGTAKGKTNRALCPVGGGAGGRGMGKGRLCHSTVLSSVSGEEGTKHHRNKWQKKKRKTKNLQNAKQLNKIKNKKSQSCTAINNQKQNTSVALR